MNLTLRVNERRYEFGEAAGGEGGWVCSKVPRDGRIMKDCVPKQEAPSWYVHLQENVDFQGCNGGHCYCDDRDGCNDVTSLRYVKHRGAVALINLTSDLEDSAW